MKSFTTYLDVFLPKSTFSPLPCDPRELFSIRRTMFKLLKQNEYEVLYGPDIKYFEEKHFDFEQTFEKWKKEFLNSSCQDQKNSYCPSLFYLAENFLSVVAKVLNGKTNVWIQIIFLFAKSGAVKKEEIQFYESYIKENHYERCWVIANRCTSQSKNHMQRIGEEPTVTLTNVPIAESPIQVHIQVQIRFISYGKLKSDWTENKFVHRYHVLSYKERQALIRSLCKKKEEEKTITPEDIKRAYEEIEKFPKILIGNSACIQTLADVGNILISTGPSMTAGESHQHKLVISQ